jgi:chemotaxis protein CheD
MVIKGSKFNTIEKIENHSTFQNVNGYPTLSIVGGEFAISSDRSNVAIKTLLGSCVAMMMYDSVLQIKGMNHFLLPTTSSSSDSYKYGLSSIETMLNEMYKLGSRKSNLKAKIAGGAHILKSHDNKIGDKNVDFAVSFCKSEGIPIVSEHVHGEHGRVIMLANDFKTFIRMVNNRAVETEIDRKEKHLSEVVTTNTKVHRQPRDEKSITWF